MKYVKHFSNTTAYEEYINGENPFLPNVSFIKQTHINKYNRWVDLFHVICKFNVNTTTAATRISYANGLFNELIIDDVERASIPTGWTFSTAGEHDVKYNLKAQTTIGQNAFSGCTRMTECTVPTAVTMIGGNAFRDCHMLKNVNIPSGLTSITGASFLNCSGLTRINSDVDGEYNIKSVTNLGGSYNFYRCYKLVNINLSDNFTSFGTNDFEECSNLSRMNGDVEGEINIPSGVTSLPNFLFRYCPKIKSINLPSGLTSIGTGVFHSCTAITRINSEVEGEFNIPSGVTSISQNAFTNCTGAVSVNLPSGMTVLSNTVFSGCTNLKKINSETEGEFNIPSGVTGIGTSAFTYCTGLESLNMPNELTTLNGSAFAKCTNLIRINSETDGVFNLPSGLTSIGEYAFDSTKVSSVVIPNGVKNINGFISCTGLTSIGITGSGAAVEIPNDATSFGAGAFRGCTNITDVNMPNTVTSIGASAFTGCNKLSAITISSGVTSIATGVFFGCSGLKRLNSDTDGVANIPSGITSIGVSAFTQCFSLTSVIIPSTVTSIGTNGFWNCNQLTSVTFSNGSTLTSIGGGAFQVCSSLTSLSLPDNAISFGNQTFYNCNHLTSITMSNSVTSFNYSSLFQNCTALKRFNSDTDGVFNLPSGLTGTLGSYAFRSCSGMTSVDVPEGVTSIGSECFRDCGNLLSVTFSNGSTLASIGVAAFQDCTALTRFNSSTNGVFNLPTSLTGTLSSNAFRRCSGMTSVVVPEGVTGIGNECFRQCGNLLTVVLPSTLTSIPSNANFYSCNKLTSITIKATTPPTLGHSNAFTDTNNCPIYVPAASVDAYKTATNWSAYASRIEAIPT